MQNPLRILHTISLCNFAGPAEAVVRLAKAQSLAGCEVKIAIETLRDGDLREKIQEEGIAMDERFVLSGKAGSIMHMRDVLTFKKIWMESKVDIIHCHRSHDHTLAAISRPASTATRLVRSIFNDRALDPRHAWQLRRADGMVVMNESTMHSLTDRGLMDRDRIFLVSAEVDPNVFRPGTGADKILEQVGIEPGSRVAGLVFDDDELDDAKWILDVWNGVNDVFPDAVLFMVHLRDEGKNDFLVDEMLSGKQSARCLHTEKYTPQIHRAFSVEIVLPMTGSRRDAHRRLALEAMATRVPIVVSKDSPAAGLLAQGCGIVINPAEDVSAKNAIAKLMSDENKAADMGARGRHEATRQNAMDHQEAKLTEFYRSLFSGTI